MDFDSSSHSSLYCPVYLTSYTRWSEKAVFYCILINLKYRQMSMPVELGHQLNIHNHQGVNTQFQFRNKELCFIISDLSHYVFFVVLSLMHEKRPNYLMTNTPTLYTSATACHKLPRHWQFCCLWCLGGMISVSLETWHVWNVI
jgi:hypothetical protein